MHNVEKGRETETFARALELEKERIARPFPDNAHYSYIDRGRYANQLRNLQRYFSGDNFHFLVFERDIRDGSHEAMRELQEFLGVEPLELGRLERKNQTVAPRIRLLNRLSKAHGVRRLAARLLPAKSLRRSLRQWLTTWNSDQKYKRQLTPQLKRQLYQRHFQHEVTRVEELTGCNLSHWRHAQGTEGAC